MFFEYFLSFAAYHFEDNSKDNFCPEWIWGDNFEDNSKDSSSDINITWKITKKITFEACEDLPKVISNTVQYVIAN